MPRAVCVKCERTTWWQARRGARLADLRCPECGGRLTAWRDPNHQRKRNPYANIRTPKEYQRDPDLRTAFRVGLRGYSQEYWYGRPLCDERLREAYEAGLAARERLLKGAAAR